MVRRALDRFFGALSRFALGLFFRRVEVVGRDRIPPPPRIVVANHVNGLIDPVFVIGPLGLPARMLGKSTLWEIPVLAQLLDLAAVIPVYRRQDEGVDPSRNRETFARAAAELANAGTLAIFPEGISHDRPQLAPLKTGVARIVLEAELTRGPLGVQIVPVGLMFEERERFRSRALVVVGEPIDPAPEVEAARTDEVAAARALTARITAALERVTLNFRDWEEARWIELGADIFEREGLDLPRQRRLAAEFQVRRALAEGLEELRERYPAEIAAAVAAIRGYAALLTTCGLRDEQVVSRYPLRLALNFVFQTLARILVALPVAVVGTALNVLPYFAVGAIAARVRDQPDQIATYKLYPSLVAYPVTWLAEAVAAGYWLGGWGSALAMALIAPLSGFVALRFHERRAVLWRETRAYLLLRSRRRIAAELLERRRAVERRMGELVARWQALQPPPDAGSPATSRA